VRRPCRPTIRAQRASCGACYANGATYGGPWPARRRIGIAYLTRRNKVSEKPAGVGGRGRPVQKGPTRVRGR